MRLVSSPFISSAALIAALSWGLPAAWAAGAAPSAEKNKPAPAAPAPPSPMEQIRADLLGIQNHILNANMRLSRNLASTAPNTAQTAPVGNTPGETCCMINLEAIGEKGRHLSGTIDQLDAHFARQRDATALDTLKTMRTQLSVVAQGLGEFRKAPTVARAKSALDGLIQPFNDLRAASEELATCCAMPGTETQPAPPAHKK